MDRINKFGLNKEKKTKNRDENLWSRCRFYERFVVQKIQPSKNVNFSQGDYEHFKYILDPQSQAFETSLTCVRV